MKIEKTIISLVLTGGIALSGGGIANASNNAHWIPQENKNYVHQGHPVQSNPMNPNKGNIRYIVKDDDTATRIVKNVHSIVDTELGYALCYYNGIKDSKNLQIGSVLLVPSVNVLRKLMEQYTVIDQRYVYNKNNVPEKLPNSSNSVSNSSVTITDETYHNDITPIIIYMPEEESPKEEFVVGTYKGITYNADLSDNYIYVVKKSDTLNKITSRHYAEMGEYHLALRNVIEAINNIKNPEKIYEGQVLRLPNGIVFIINDNVDTIFHLQPQSNTRILRP